MTSAWREAPLGELLLRLFDHRGRTPKKLGGDFVESGVRVISAKNIRDGRLDLETNVRFITREMFDRWMPEKLRPGDVLLTERGPRLHSGFAWVPARLVGEGKKNYRSSTRSPTSM